MNEIGCIRPPCRWTVLRDCHRSTGSLAAVLVVAVAVAAAVVGNASGRTADNTVHDGGSGTTKESVTADGDDRDIPVGDGNAAGHADSDCTGPGGGTEASGVCCRHRRRSPSP